MGVIDTSRIESDLKRLENEEEGLRQRINGLLAEKAKLKSALEILERYGFSEGSQPSAQYEGMTIADAVEEYLKRVGGKAQVTVIRDELVNAGKLRGKAASRYGTLVQTMGRHKGRFARTGTGVWQLVNYNAPSANGTSGEPSPAVQEAVREI